MSLHVIAMLSILASPLGAEQGRTVRVDVTGGYLFVDATINGKPARLVIDSGAEMNALTPEAAKKFGIEGGQTATATGTGATGISAIVTKIKQMQVGTATVKNESVVVIPLPPELGCDGLVGYSFLHHFVTTFDYQAGTATFEDAKSYRRKDGATVLPLQVRTGIPEVKGSVEGFEGWLSLDTGSGGTLALFTPFVEKNKLRERFPNKVSMITGAGVGGVTTGDIVRIGTVKIGSFALPPIISDLSKQKAGAFASDGPIGNIGYDILRRFRITIDYPGKHLILEKSPEFDVPSETNRSGIYMTYANGEPRVLLLRPEGPGAAAGLKAGDVLVGLDGQPTKGMHPLQFRSCLRRAAGTVLKFLVKRGNESPIEIAVTLKEVVP